MCETTPTRANTIALGFKPRPPGPTLPAWGYTGAGETMRATETESQNLTGGGDLRSPSLHLDPEGCLFGEASSFCLP